MSLDEVRARLARAAVLLDFDGALAPIVERPQDAAPLGGIREVLAGLAPRVAALVVVTGRPSSFVSRHLPGIEVAGLYGREGAQHLDPDLVARVGRLAGAVLGAHVEDKGVSVAVHARGASDPGSALRSLRSGLMELAAERGLQLLEGKLVLELAPAGADKGSVVREVVARTFAEVVLYAGDDLADLSAFGALEELARSGTPICRVAVGGPETPAELLERADLVVDGPEGLLHLLRSL